MKTDLYTKIILTVIAVALLGILFQNVDLVPKAVASDFNTKPHVIVPINPDGSINVKLNSTLDVNIESVDAYAFSYCTVPVHVE